jgi:KDO2-lipid IV(A) lauroyltransferase
MDSRQIQKEIGRFIGWAGLNFSSLIIRFVPACYIYGFARSMSFIWYRIAAKQRNIAIESLTIAFGKEKSREEIKRIAEDCFVFIAKAGLELMFLMKRPEQLKERVTFEGRENLEKALSGGRGAILVSAHFGNFPLMMARLALSGYTIAGIMRPMHETRAEKMFMKMRTDAGIKTIYAQPRVACVNKTIEALRNNELVFIPIDQNFGSGGIFVDFFG